VYESGRLSYEEHDTNQDGKVDRRVEFEQGKRAVEIEDRNHNGKMDFWTFYDSDGIPVRTQQDADEDGQPEMWEFYEGDDPSRVVLTRKEEDVNADGKVDITSYYEQGKLARKEVSDPDLLLQ
jgi:antitoxin component YwqK of YwqJK toxin-antitoxin module